tara:strand:+ start:198 stop:563 length:366 start_codon:yes stop_codon:yes gene_type:complete
VLERHAGTVQSGAAGGEAEHSAAVAVTTAALLRTPRLNQNADGVGREGSGGGVEEGRVCAAREVKMEDLRAAERSSRRMVKSSKYCSKQAPAEIEEAVRSCVKKVEPLIEPAFLNRRLYFN